MAKTISQRELRNNGAAIMDGVEAGESCVVTRNGHPVAELCPVRTRPRRFVPKAELAALVAGAPQIDAKRFREDIDRVVDQRLYDPYTRCPLDWSTHP
jgi:prevent-host-death family protein